MTRRIDRRVARTERALHQALMSLILHKGYDALTVQDITDEADISRSTFYAHYTGKEDLLRSGFRMLRDELKQAAQAARAAGPREEPLGFSLAMFEHVGRYRDAARILTGGRGGIVVETEIRRALAEVVREELADLADDTVAHELRVQFVVGAFLTVLNWWLERKPRLSPAEVDAMLRRLLIDGIAPRHAAASPGSA